MIQLSYGDRRTLCQQLKDSIRRLTVTGALGPGEELPAAGAMAVSLAVNPAVVRRAYDELAAEGYLTDQEGTGRFSVAQGGGDGAQRECLLALFDDTAARLVWLGVPRGELAGRIPARQERRSAL